MISLYINIMPFELSGFNATEPIPDHLFINCKKSEKGSFVIEEIAKVCNVLPSQVVLMSYRTENFTEILADESISSVLYYGVHLLAYLVML